MKKSPPFKLHAEHAALDFVNTLDDRFATRGPTELLSSYNELLRFCRQTGLFTPTQSKRLSALPSQAQENGLRSAIELREALARIFYGLLEGRAPAADGRAALERWSVDCAQHRELAWKGDRLAWRWSRGLDADVLAPALVLSQAALDLLTADDPPRLHACACESCRWLFLDTSRNGTRRWCDMKICGNRAKARRYGAAHRQQQDDPVCLL